MLWFKLGVATLESGVKILSSTCPCNVVADVATLLL